MELTKSSRFEYGNTAITLQRLVIVNPVLFKTYFTTD